MNPEIVDCFSRGDYLAGVKYASANSISPNNDPYSSHVVAACLFRLGQFKESYALLTELESSLSDSHEFLSLYGVAARRLGYLDQAEKLLSKALEINSEDLSLRNNYANILIDLDRLVEANEILDQILEVDSNFVDASINLNRLKLIQQSRHTQNLSSSSSISTNPDATVSLDPLALAFAEEEVRLHGRLKASSIVEKIPSSDERKVAIDKLRVAEQAISEGKPDFALQLCSEILQVCGPMSAIYDCVADSYIQKKMYIQAELMYLHSAALDQPTVKHFINLFTLSIIRGDGSLAKHFLEQVSALAPDHDRLPQMKNQLTNFYSDKSRTPYTFLAS